jgi:hypothetical protein
MVYVLTYTILIGTSRREALTAHAAMSELLAIKLAGGSNISVLDPRRTVFDDRSSGRSKQGRGHTNWNLSPAAALML